MRRTTRHNPSGTNREDASGTRRGDGNRLADQVQQIIRKLAQRDRSPHMIRFLLKVKLLEERGGLPQDTGEPPRPVWAQVRELDVQLEQLSEMIAWNRPMAIAVLTATHPFTKQSCIC